MKYFLIGMIKVYQMIPFSSHVRCRFNPRCSDYGIEAISKYGSIRGSIMTFKRIIRCNPFNKNCGYDPLEELKK